MLPKKILIEFEPNADNLNKKKELRDGLSVVLQIKDTLWVANDETVGLEKLRLLRNSEDEKFSKASMHKHYCLYDFLKLPVDRPKNPKDLEEIDVEGLAYDGHYLWLTGSHSLKRKNPDVALNAKTIAKELGELSSDGNRYILARIPVVDDEDGVEIVKKHKKKSKHYHAAQLVGDKTGNELTKALQKDIHIGPFMGIPGKDNGFDIEGLAVCGKRIFLGLRGPVLRGWAMILEIEPKVSSKKASWLKLKPIGPKKTLYRKHFIYLNGLGIRDLCADGNDMLILAGPTMDLDGPVSVMRWKGGASPQKPSCVRADELEKVFDIPFGFRKDHAEGIAFFASRGDTVDSVIAVHDSASEERQIGESSVLADLFALPASDKAN